MSNSTHNRHPPVFNSLLGGGGKWMKKIIILANFFKNFEKFFWPIQSDFGSKLSGKSIFFGLMVLKKFLFS